MRIVNAVTAAVAAAVCGLVMALEGCRSSCRGCLLLLDAGPVPLCHAPVAAQQLKHNPQQLCEARLHHLP